MYCVQCGLKNIYGSKFCMNCGYIFIDVEIEENGTSLDENE